MKHNWIGCFFVHTAILLIAATFATGCYDDNDNSDAEDNFPTEEEVQEVLERQMSYYRQFKEFLSVMDTSSAKDSIISIIRQDALVDWVLSTSQGINIRWKIMDGGFFISSERKTSSGRAAKNMGQRSPSSEHECFAPLPRPKKFGALFAAPMMAEYLEADNYIITEGNRHIREAGYDEFIVKANEECDLAFFTQLSDSNYGIIRISSEGEPWPSEQNIEDVYVLTKEIPRLNTSAGPLNRLLRNGVGATILKDTLVLMINVDFIIMNNNFTDTSPLIWLGFCYSALGDWLQWLDIYGAGAVVGYSWVVRDSMDSGWVVDMLEKMCDTDRDKPMSIYEWYSSIDTMYIDAEDSAHVAIRYNGDSNFVLWQRSNYYAIVFRGFDMHWGWMSDGGSGSSVEENWAIGWIDTAGFTGNRFSGSRTYLMGEFVVEAVVEITFDPVTWNIQQLFAQKTITGATSQEVSIIRATNIPMVINNYLSIRCKLEGADICSHVSQLNWDFESHDQDGNYSSWINSWTCRDNSELEVLILRDVEKSWLAADN